MSNEPFRRTYHLRYSLPKSKVHSKSSVSVGELPCGRWFRKLGKNGYNIIFESDAGFATVAARLAQVGIELLVIVSRGGVWIIRRF